MLDEAHERTAQIDIVMGLLKKVLKKREDLRLIISSATVDAEYLRDFFNIADVKNAPSKSTDIATVLSVEGTGYFLVEKFNPSPKKGGMLVQ